MTRIEKLIMEIQRSKAEVKFDDVRKLLTYYGYRKIRQRGSHVHFRKSNSGSITFRVHSGRVKQIYIKEIIKILHI